MLFLGIDGGGSKTEAVIIDDHLRVIGFGRAGGSNTSFTTAEKAADSFRSAISAALQDAGAGGGDISAAGCTFGSVAHQVFNELGIHVRPLGLGECQVAFERAGYEEFVGVALIAGTGSSCTGKNRGGEIATAGGWGAVLGDDGSAFDIGRRGIRRAIYAAEGRMPETALSRMACDYFGLDTPRRAVGALTGTKVNQALIAGFAVRVSEAARLGDEAASHILEQAGENLGELAAFVGRRLFSADEDFPFVLAGGVFEAGEPIVSQVRAVLSPQFPNATIALAEMSPGEAAARLTYRTYVKIRG